MSVADYVKKRFFGKELCISVNNGETETVSYDGVNSMNREYLRGIVVEAEDDVVALDIAGWGIIHINTWDISFFWESQDNNLHAAFHTSLTKKLGRPSR